MDNVFDMDWKWQEYEVGLKLESEILVLLIHLETMSMVEFS